MNDTIQNCVTEYGRCERCGEIGHHDGFWAFGYRFLMCKHCHERTDEEWDEVMRGFVQDGEEDF